MVCQHCGAALAATVTASGTGMVCLECGVAQSPVSQFTTRPLDWGWDESLAQTEPKTERAEPPLGTHPLSFTGTAGEFFRIWIVNVFLTVITLGIYNAWAKVRTRQYFYANTHLAGHSFDYLANPINILKGNLIVGAGLIIYNLTDAFAPLWSLLIMGLFALVFPFLAYQSLRFRTRYSAYRNIRFHFHGTLGESYRVFLLIPFFVLCSLGLLFPYMLSRQKEYAFGRFAFGTTRSKFYGGPGKFFKVYLLAALLVVGFFATVFFAFDAFIFSSYDSDTPSLYIAIALMYLGSIAFFSMIQEFIYVNIANYCWAETQLGKVSFRSTLRLRDLAWIRLTNLFAMLLSFGLLIPWAKVRRTRYIVEHLAVVMREDDLDAFVADESNYQSSLGDVATDALDIEIGL